MGLVFTTQAREPQSVLLEHCVLALTTFSSSAVSFASVRNGMQWNNVLKHLCQQKTLYRCFIQRSHTGLLDRIVVAYSDMRCDPSASDLFEILVEGEPSKEELAVL